MDNVLMLLLLFVVFVVVAYSWSSMGEELQLPLPALGTQGAQEEPTMYMMGDDFQFSEEAPVELEEPSAESMASVDNLSI